VKSTDIVATAEKSETVRGRGRRRRRRGRRRRRRFVVPRPGATLLHLVKIQILFMGLTHVTRAELYGKNKSLQKLSPIPGHHLLLRSAE
jgi:hypothetical protein